MLDILLKRNQLEVHQVKMVDFFKRVLRGQGFAEMGSGKTISVLTAFVDLQNDFEVSNLLVVAPLRVATKTWPDEIQQWEHTRHLRFRHLSGGAVKMARDIDLYRHVTDVWSVSCDSVHALSELYYAKRHPFDWVCIDESSRFKNGSSKRSQSLKLLTIHPKRVTNLTGTPAPNGVKDLWAQTYMVDRGVRLGRTMADFKKKFYSNDAGTVSTRPHASTLARVNRAIGDISLVINEGDFPVDFHVVPNYIRLPLSDDLQAAYKEFERKYVLKLPDINDITAVNEAALGTKLLQFASGAVYDENREPQYIHSAKIEALKEIVEDNEGKPILAAYSFQHEIPRILEAFPHAEVFGKDPTQQDRWNRGEISMLIAHPKSAAHGLNLQYGGNILVWFSFNYNLEEYLQMNKRLARKGQKGPVYVHHLIVENTIDEMVMRALRRKDDEQNTFTRELKKHILELIKLYQREEELA